MVVVKQMVFALLLVVGITGVAVLVIPWVGFIAVSLWPSWLNVERYFNWCQRKQTELTYWAREECKRRGIKP